MAATWFWRSAMSEEGTWMRQATGEGQKAVTTTLYIPDPNRQRDLSAAEKRRLDAMTPEQIEANAATDPDNPPLTRAELSRVRSVAKERRAGAKTGLSKAAFAQRFRITQGRLKDLGQGRTAADSILLAYFQVIETAPSVVERALAKANR